MAHTECAATDGLPYMVQIAVPTVRCSNCAPLTFHCPSRAMAALRVRMASPPSIGAFLTTTTVTTRWPFGRTISAVQVSVVIPPAVSVAGANFAAFPLGAHSFRAASISAGWSSVHATCA